MQRLKKFFSLGSICLTVILLCTTTTPAFVYASNPSAVQENQNIEQLIKIDLETGDETIVDLPSISTISEIERNSSSSSEPSLHTVYDDDNRTVISNTNADTYKGNSGSPTYAYSSSYGNQVYGIHTHGGNYSRRITMSLFDWLESEGFIQ